MAVVKAPALSLDASGNLGGICYTSWRGLNIARDTWTGTDPNTGLQQAMRAITKSVVQAWGGTLVAGMRVAWNEAAQSQIRMSRVKTTYIPTGYQYFVQLNIQRIRQGGALMLLPPAAIDPYTWTTFRLGYNYMTEMVNLHFEDELNQGAFEVSAEIWRAGPYDSGGRRALDGEDRFLKFIQPITDDTDGGRTVGKYYWYRARVIDDYGRVQGWFEKQILIPVQNDGKMISNGDFSAWTADDPDDWDVGAETGDTYITEGVLGADWIGIAGQAFQIRQFPLFPGGRKYKLFINNTRVVNHVVVYVKSGGIFYVPSTPVQVNNFTAVFDFQDDSALAAVYIIKEIQLDIELNITLAQIWIID